ncbi:MAG TPA: hypothetical protein VIX17_05760 [Pyrinomonadaceae bacterium]|jgi:hypothetical protein
MFYTLIVDGDGTHGRDEHDEYSLGDRRDVLAATIGTNFLAVTFELSLSTYINQPAG